MRRPWIPPAVRRSRRGRAAPVAPSRPAPPPRPTVQSVVAAPAAVTAVAGTRESWRTWVALAGAGILGIWLVRPTRPEPLHPRRPIPDPDPGRGPYATVARVLASQSRPRIREAALPAIISEAAPGDSGDLTEEDADLAGQIAEDLAQDLG